MKTRSPLRGDALIEQRAFLIAAHAAAAAEPVHRADLAALFGLANEADRGLHKATARARALDLIESRTGNGAGFYAGPAVRRERARAGAPRVGC